MAEAFLNSMGGEYFIAESAGLEPGKLNPIVVEVMKEAGYDISKNSTKGVFDFFKQGKFFQYVIAVCDEASAERCPIFPGMAKRLNWSFRDPSSFTGTEESKLLQTRIVRDQIRDEIEKFIRNHHSISF
jgi:arsenate reductase